ncbi:MAG: amidophosphoribosyltransferase [bacterium]
MSDRLKEACGVFAVHGNGFEAARLTYHGLWALQHRGQESSGIAASDGTSIRVHKGQGLVAHVYSEPTLAGLPGHLAIGHNRYSTSGGPSGIHAQPVLKAGAGFELAFAHNGNLPSFHRLKRMLAAHRIDTDGKNDSECMAEAIALFLSEGKSLEEAIVEVYPLFTGVFSFVAMTRDSLAAVKDRCGIRPLAIGKLDESCHVISSETCALDTVGASFVREIEPGEMVVVDGDGPRWTRIVEGRPRLDVFELVYFARPDSILAGRRVNEVRRKLGTQLAAEWRADADLVVPVPDSAIPSALGYASATGIPFDNGLIKNRYIHRTFIRPDPHLRRWGVRMKLNPLPEAVAGKRVVLIDDSIVRGTTVAEIIRIIRRAGAREVHVGIASPPVVFPDFYGIDTPLQEELIAFRMGDNGILEHIGADSLHYLSRDGLIRAVGVPEEQLCTSIFTGDYPIDIGERASKVSGLPRRPRKPKAASGGL